VRFDPDREAVRDLIAQYDDEASVYLDHWAPVIHPLACAALKGLSSDGVERVLDIGAGVGMLLPVLREKFPAADVIGVDRSYGMLSLCVPDESVAVVPAPSSSPQCTTRSAEALPISPSTRPMMAKQVNFLHITILLQKKGALR